MIHLSEPIEPSSTSLLLKRFRISRNYSAEYVAKMCKMSVETYLTLEAQPTSVKLTTLVNVFNVLNLGSKEFSEFQLSCNQEIMQKSQRQQSQKVASPLESLSNKTKACKLGLVK